MIHLVTGMQRSGTAAVMRAAIMGGIVGNYFAPYDAVIGQYKHLRNPDYDPNPYGFFEYGPVAAIEAHGMVSKIMLAMIGSNFPELMAVVMHRPEAERAASLAEWDFNTDEFLYGFEEHYANFKALNPDADIIDVEYAELVAYPYRELRRLQDAGWPVDAAKAANAINPALYRHRLAA